MKLLVLCCVLLAGCALSPEAKLERGYQVVSGAAKTATVLVQRDAISPDDAQKVLTLGETGKQILDGGKERLKACRAAGGQCDGAVANIDLGAGVLLELERFLAKMTEAK